MHNRWLPSGTCGTEESHHYPLATNGGAHKNIKLDSKYGDSVVEKLSVDLKAKYPEMGLSPRNLWDMRRFYLRYNEEDIKLRQAVAVLPWRI